MPVFTSFDGLPIHYEIAGDGDPVLLLHSFPFNSRIWTSTGVTATLAGAGRRVILADRRGSGQSGRPHDPAAYAGNACARDVSCLLDHLGLESADLGSYSLGAMIALRVLMDEPRIRRAVLGGVGDEILRLDTDWLTRVADGLADPVSESPDRVRAERLGEDPQALAALWRAPFVTYDSGLDRVEADVLVLKGERDGHFGDPAALAEALPHGRTVRTPTDHVSTMDHPMFAAELIAHLSGQHIR